MWPSNVLSKLLLKTWVLQVRALCGMLFNHIRDELMVRLILASFFLSSFSNFDASKAVLPYHTLAARRHKSLKTFENPYKWKQKKNRKSACPYKRRRNIYDKELRLNDIGQFVYHLQRVRYYLSVNDMRYESARFRTFENCNQVTFGIELAKEGFYYSSTGSSGCIKCYFCDKVCSIDSQSIPKHCDGRNNPKNVAKEDEPAPNSVLMDSLIQRDLPPRNNSSPTSVQDRVRCYSCGIELSICADGKDPWEIHARESRNCDHVNTARNQENSRHPEHATRESRLATFQSWPSNNIITAEELATAGLFYVGVGDLVRCFCCGGGLRKWVAGDEPWIEHARLFPKCIFVLREKGENFGIDHRMANTNGNNTQGMDVGVEENNRLNKSQSCKICKTNDINIVFLPCTHMVSCSRCAPMVTECHTCKSPIKSSVQVYKV